ncbi:MULTISPECIES: hypothetical protein [unclassified Haloferax]|nr:MULTISPECIES: hypothetical protein [unclassified Haloferax]
MGRTIEFIPRNSSSRDSRLNSQYNLLEAEGTSRDREYSLVDSAAASPMQ